MTHDRAHDTPLQASRHEVDDLLGDNRGLEVQMEDWRDEARRLLALLEAQSAELAALKATVARLEGEVTRLLALCASLEAETGRSPLTGRPRGGAGS